MTSEENKRRHERLPSDMEAGLRMGSAQGSVLEAKVKDISSGGAFIETDNEYQIGQIVSFSVTLPGDEEPLMLFGRVKRVQAEAPVGIGIEFIRTRRLEPTISIIERYIKKLPREIN